MGLTKEYLRYAPAGNFNIIVSPQCNVKFVTLEGQEGRYVAVGACEHIIIWDLRLGEKAQVLSGEKTQVSCLCASPNGRHLAAGYVDGTIQIYDLKSGDIVSIFAGHKYDITTLAFDQFGHKLASGSKDTEVIVWDTVAETGVCRLSGHKGAVTQVTFMAEHGVLVSGSKDGFVKMWDLDTQHCFKTLVGHRSEVWAVCLAKNDQYLITGCGDAELRVWKIIHESEQSQDLTTRLEQTEITDDDDPRYPLRVIKAGSLLRAGRGRVVSMYVNPTGQVLTCHGTDQQVELFQFCSDEEANNRLKKRVKKEKKKAKASEAKTEECMEVEPPKNIPECLTLRDEVRRLPAIKLTAKPKSMDIVFGGGGEIRISVSLSNNVIEMYSLCYGGSKTEAPQLLRSIRQQGHRAEIRAVAFSSDNLAIISGGADGVKLWNRPSQTCLRTCADDCYVVSVCFVPGDRHILAGLKDGRLLIVDIAAGDVLEEIPAHTAGTEVWSICLLPDLRGCVTGGGDKTCKWWQFELIQDESSESKAKVLSLLHTRTLALEEAVLCVKLTPDERYVCVALLDSTVKVFFADSFKLHVSLYGHKLPVLCMDVSFDSRLIATGSADRNLKIWGLDFGDCHKSLFAHDDSVTGVSFVPRTHLVFSCGKDGAVRQWDADTFDRITTLPSHKGEAWSLTISPDARHVVSCGGDRVIRALERTEQPLVLEDEREEEREREESEQLATGDGERTIPGNNALSLPTRKTVGSERAADSLLECLSICAIYREQLSEHAALQAASKTPITIPAPPPLMMAYQANTPEDFLVEIIKRIRTSELEEALLLLPFTSACELLQCLPALVERGDQTELVSKVLIFLLKVHHAPLVANQALLPLLRKIQKQATAKVTELRDMVGYNLHGLQYLQREIEIAEGVQLFRDASREKRTKDKKRRQREKAKRSIMVLNA